MYRLVFLECRNHEPCQGNWQLKRRRKSEKIEMKIGKRENATHRPHAQLCAFHLDWMRFPPFLWECFCYLPINQFKTRTSENTWDWDAVVDFGTNSNNYVTTHNFSSIGFTIHKMQELNNIFLKHSFFLILKKQVVLYYDFKNAYWDIYCTFKYVVIYETCFQTIGWEYPLQRQNIFYAS